MDQIVPLCLGIGLAAACGFRVFVPLLGISVAAFSGHVQLISSMEWMGTWPALLCFLVATVVEIGAYYIPWLDNALDTLATPAAVVAGSMITASVVQEMSPLMRWSLAIIAGGGLAGLVQTATVALRGTSTATTAGGGNFLVSTGELLSAILATLCSLLFPVVAVLLLAVLVGVAARIVLSRRRPTDPKLAAK